LECVDGSIENDVMMNGRGKNSEGVNMNRLTSEASGLVVREC
jgi:hypothetical protein